MLNILYVYIVYWLSGIGFAYLLAPRQIAIAIAPVITYCLISIVSVYCLAFNIDRTYLPYYGYALLFFSILLAIYSSDKKGLHIQQVNKFSMLMMLFVAYFLNNYQDGTLFFSINPDIAAYLASSEWLKYSTNFLSQLNVSLPMENEILNKALRWGLPFNLSFLSLSIDQPTYALIFPLTICIFYSSMVTAVNLFNKHYEVFSALTKELVISLILLNTSTLYLMYEGFYPHIIGVSILSILLFLFIQPEHSFKYFLLNAILVAGLLSNYSESFILYLLLVSGIVALRLIRFNSKPINYVRILSIGMGLLIVLPLGIKLFYFTFANVHNINNIGYPQPSWLLPSDVVGLTTIYNHLANYIAIKPHVVAQSNPHMIVAGLLSAWVIYELIHQIRIPLVLVTMLIGLGFFVKNIYTPHYSPINYLYDKLIVLMAVIFMCYFYKGVFQSKNYFKIILCTVLTVHTFFSFVSAKNFTFRGSAKMDDLVKISQFIKDKDVSILTNQRGMRQGKLIPQLLFVDRAHDIIFEGYNYKLLDPSNFDCHRYKPSASIFLVAKKKGFLNLNLIYEKFRPDIVLDTNQYLLIDRHITIDELCNKNINILSLFIKG